MNTVLDDAIKEYLWKSTDRLTPDNEATRDLLELCRKTLSADLVSVRESHVGYNGLTFIYTAYSDKAYDYQGRTIDMDKNRYASLVRELDDDYLHTGYFGCLGSDIKCAKLDYVICDGALVEGIVSIMDFHNPDREWTDDERAIIKRIGCIMSRVIQYNHLKAEHEQLIEAMARADREKEAKRKFLSSMSHDIRTPMNAIMGFAALAKTHICEHARVQDYLAKIVNSSKHLLSLINDILDMSRIENGRIHLEEAPCNLPVLVHGLQEMISAQSKAKQLTFNVSVKDVVHEWVLCDKMRINQIAINLLSNAIKFTEQYGTINVTITELSGAPSGTASFELCVEDNGVGISEDFIDNVFEPFERENDKAHGNNHGAGLGLAIAKNIVELMGGTISVESKLGVGTKFSVTINFKLPEEQTVIPVIDEIQGVRVLVIDDDFDACYGAVNMLEAMGMKPEWSMHANEAVLKAKMAKDKNNAYGLYIVDWEMAEQNGEELIQIIRNEVNADAKIVVFSSLASMLNVNEIHLAGADGLCCKPVFMSELSACLQDVYNCRPVEEDEHQGLLDEAFLGHRILLVEDNELNQEIAVAILEEAGFFVELASNGQIAVDKVVNSQAGHYDVILMDIKMPVMDGYEATRQIRSLADPSLAGIPIIAMTADAFAEDKAAAIEAGMNEHIAKPIDVAKLFDALRKVLEV